jgi:gamma-glutamyl-gamma-aminobutyrate hydrolase PuuD
LLASHSDDREVEAISYFPFYPAHTVQWHPEEIHDEFSITLINHLLSAYE